MAAFRRVGAAAAAAAALFTAGGCASDAPPARSNSVTLVGLVLSGPRCPGPERLDSPCPPGPVEGSAVAALSGGHLVASTKTDQQGRFRLDLPPATYLIRATNIGGYRSTVVKTVTLTPNHRISITLLLDTGMR